MLILSATNPTLTLTLNHRNQNTYDSSPFLFHRKLHQASPPQRQAFVFSSFSSVQHPGDLRRVSDDGQTSSPDISLVSSASAVAAAIRRASTSPVEFLQRIEADPKSGMVLPSAEFQRLCAEQLDLFRRIVDPNAALSVYVRPAGSYVMDRLELRGVTAYPGVNVNEVVILVGSFSVPAGLRSAEAVLSNKQVEFVAESKAAVFPMVKDPFVVGFLVAEFRGIEIPNSRCDPSKESDALPLASNDNSLDIQPRMSKLTSEQRSNAVNISRSLAMAYVMDQKAMLLQQSSWQNNVRMNKLVEQIRGPLSSIRILSRLLSRQTRKGEIAYDIAEDLLIQGDHIRDTLEQLQDAVYVTKANIVRHNEENLKKMDGATYKIETLGDSLTVNTSGRDLELPMPPPQLAPLRQNEIRPCNVSGVLADLAGAIVPLARKQKRLIKLSDSGQSLLVAIEEPALRQALSNLIEGALLRTQVEGKVEIVCMNAPAGGALVIIDDDGPDMHYMTQMHSLTPFGAELCLEEMVEDNMTWNFVAGLTVAREILESYGCVVRIVSPRIKDAALGAGGTRVELWLPCFVSLPDFDASDQML